jgi:hypothetical protein
MTQGTALLAFDFTGVIHGWMNGVENTWWFGMHFILAKALQRTQRFLIDED